MKATTMLRRQHDRIAQVVGALEHEKHLRAALFMELGEELMALIAIEESVFYPCVQDVAGVRLSEHRADHARARSALQAIASCVPPASSDAAAFASRFRELRTTVERHIALERSALFPAVESELGDEALEHLGKRMREFLSARASLARTTSPTFGVGGAVGDLLAS